MNSLKGRRRWRRRKPLEFRQIAPNMVTSGNLLCGLFSLMLAVEGRFVPAAWLIFFATLFDGLDGKVARSLGGGTQFGLEFDSLADLVSFGIAPGMLFYLVSFRGVLGILGAAVSCFFVLCVALRLARFNVVHVPGPFQGLPSPAGGLFAASFVLADAVLPPVAMAAVLGEMERFARREGDISVAGARDLGATWDEVAAATGYSSGVSASRRYTAGQRERAAQIQRLRRKQAKEAEEVVEGDENDS